MRMIKVVVTTDGTTSIEAVGFKGKECLAATMAIEQAIGKIDSRKAKPEMGSEVAEQSVTQEG